MKKFYTDEKNAQVIIALLKEHNIRKFIVSPGTTNMPIVGSVQNDPFFEVYSSVDERSAAYMACGLSSESDEPVVLSCTGATASRNYLPGLTEAYYRKLPILAITSTPDVSKVGHNVAQVIDRSSLPNDVAKLSLTLPIIKDEDDLWDCEIKVNKAILELKRYGGGPVHINLPTTYCKTFDTTNLPEVRLINRVTSLDKFPELPKGKTAIIVGSHAIMSQEQTDAIDEFCASNNAVVLCDHTSNYKGKYRILCSIAACQEKLYFNAIHVELLIHIGEITGDYFTIRSLRAKQVWRVSEDGEIKDLFRSLRYVFEMPEKGFFEYYSDKMNINNDSYLKSLQTQISEIYKKIPDLPYSNIWIASKMSQEIPEGSSIHFAILNSLRSWNFFELPDSVNSTSNVGGFGIDGCMSSLIGASLTKKNKLFFGVIGDLAFFYDMNVLGNRHLGNNLRILLVNNGKGQEFKNFNHPASNFKEDGDTFIAAGGHFGNKSKNLIKNYAQDLGFEYFTASNKADFEEAYKQFLSPEISERSILFEVFTNELDESEALRKILNTAESVQGKAKKIAKHLLGDKIFKSFKKIIKK